MYTLNRSEADRDLRVEKGLSRLEEWFSQLRKSKLDKRKALDSDDKWVLATFLAVQQLRTSSFVEHQRMQWKETLHRMEELYQHNAAGVLHPSNVPSNSMVVEEVQQFITNMPAVMVGLANRMVPVITQMHFTVFCRERVPFFLTSDDPVTWIDPKAHELPPIYQSPGLLTPSLEITLPLSPWQSLFVRHRTRSDAPPLVYRGVSEAIVREANLRIQANCKNSYVANTNQVQPHWFGKARNGQP